MVGPHEGRGARRRPAPSACAGAGPRRTPAPRRTTLSRATPACHHRSCGRASSQEIRRRRLLLHRRFTVALPEFLRTGTRLLHLGGVSAPITVPARLDTGSGRRRRKCVGVRSRPPALLLARRHARPRRSAGARKGTRRRLGDPRTARYLRQSLDARAASPRRHRRRSADLRVRALVAGMLRAARCRPPRSRSPAGGPPPGARWNPSTVDERGPRAPLGSRRAAVERPDPSCGGLRAPPSALSASVNGHRRARQRPPALRHRSRSARSARGGSATAPSARCR